jgi:hypothetical protein
MVVRSVIRRWCSVLAFLPLAGCATMQDVHYEATQKLRTECAFLHFCWCSDEWIDSDYGKGWKAGYLDVLTGGDGQPPLVAPRCYWAPSQVLKHGDQKRHDWYVGFQDGAMMASVEPDTHYVKIWNPTPTVQPAGYYEAPASPTSEPRPAPPSEAPALKPMPDTSGTDWNSSGRNPAIPVDSNLPPVPEKPEAIE